MSMHTTYDAIVVGMGAMGSSALYHLATRGLKVLGIERFNIPHEMGSSHGITRIIRLAYFEHPSYVPLLQRSFELWKELENRTGEELLHITGSIDAGPPDSEVVQGSRRSCAAYDLPHELLTSRELRRRFPGFRLPDGAMALFQPQGGFLLPERCISTHVMVAQSLGAEVHAREQVLSWEAHPDHVEVRTEAGTYRGKRLILAAGAWMPRVAPMLKEIAVPERQVLAWFQPAKVELFAPARFPVFNLRVEEGHFYGFPVFGVPGFKIGRYHHLSEVVDPEIMDRACHPRDEQILRQCAEKYFPDGAGPTMSMHACIFTNTPDEHFILDLCPGVPQVVLCSACSGHGFKFSSVIGEILADLAQKGETRHDISLHRVSRFSTIA